MKIQKQKFAWVPVFLILNACGIKGEPEAQNAEITPVIDVKTLSNENHSVEFYPKENSTMTTENLEKVGIGSMIVRKLDYRPTPEYNVSTSDQKVEFETFEVYRIQKKNEPARLIAMISETGFKLLHDPVLFQKKEDYAVHPEVFCDYYLALGGASDYLNLRCDYSTRKCRYKDGSIAHIGDPASYPNGYKCTQQSLHHTVKTFISEHRASHIQIEFFDHAKMNVKKSIFEIR